MRIIGIDPGLSGAVAVLDGARLVSVCDTPTIKVGKKPAYNLLAMESMIGDVRAASSFDTDDIRVGLETQRAMPKQGVTSMFSLGMGYGIWIGLLVGMGLSYELVQPKAWRKTFSLKPGKGASLEAAARLFPCAELRGPRGGGKDGRADALLIAEHVRRLNG